MQPSLAAFALALVAACSGAPATSASTDPEDTNAAANEGTTAAPGDAPFAVAVLTRFDEPWAMTFLPDGRMLVTEKKGRLKLYAIGGTAVDVAGVPAVDYGGQGGLGDIVLHPDFASNGVVYISYAEAGDGDTRGAAVARATLVLGDAPRLDGLQVVWRQQPKVTGRGHYGHRIAFGPDGMMYVSAGDRQKLDPAQDLDGTMGKIVRLTDAGAVPDDNPFSHRGGAAAQVWSYGHRNPLGLAFDADGRLWNTEMGPANGDELNLVVRGANHGWPVASMGDHYDGRDIPDHAPGDGFAAPQQYWVPGIAPGSLMIYSGKLFADWTGDAFIGALGGESLLRVDLDGATVKTVDRWEMQARIREVEQGPDGAIWLLEDGRSGGRLLKLTPRWPPVSQAVRR
jgi:glucose/arabinose dehydrogenase